MRKVWSSGGVVLAALLAIGWQSKVPGPPAGSGPYPSTITLPQRSQDPCRGNRCDSNMATQFIDVSQGTGGIDGWTDLHGAGAANSVDTTVKMGGYGSLKVRSGGFVEDYYIAQTGVLAAAGRRISFWMYCDAIGAATRHFFYTPTAFMVGVNASGLLMVMDNTNTQLAGSTTGVTPLVAGVWNRIAISYVITSTTVFNIKVYLNGVLEASAINQGTLTGSTTADMRLMPQLGGANQQTRFQHVYIDNGTDSADPAGVGKHLYLTAKLPTANGSNNAYTTHGSSTGTGTGHAAWVSERPWNGTDYLDQTTGGSLDEDYAIQGASVGDDDISTGATLVARASWQMAQLSGSGASPTMSIFNNSTVTSFTPAAAFALVTSLADSATYPATAPIIGQRSTKGSGKVPAIAAAGMVLAYTRGFPVGRILNVNQTVMRAANY